MSTFTSLSQALNEVIYPPDVGSRHSTITGVTRKSRSLFEITEWGNADEAYLLMKPRLNRCMYASRSTCDALLFLYSVNWSEGIYLF